MTERTKFRARRAITGLVLVVSAGGVIAWQFKSIDVPGLEDDALPVLGEESAEESADLKLDRGRLPASAEPVRFRIAKALDPGATKIPVVAQGGYCVGSRKSAAVIKDVKVEESASAVKLTVIVRQGPSPAACAGVGETLYGLAELESKLGKRRLLDGRKDPPAPVHSFRLAN